MLQSVTVLRKSSLFRKSLFFPLILGKNNAFRSVSTHPMGLTNASDSDAVCGSSLRSIKLHVKVGSAANEREHVFEAPVGVSLLEAIRDVGKLEIEAACDGTCACSTCHVIFSPESYSTVLGANENFSETTERMSLENAADEKISEEEKDMLDLAPSLCVTSRLACQVALTEKLQGKDLFLRIPEDR